MKKQMLRYLAKAIETFANEKKALQSFSFTVEQLAEQPPKLKQHIQLYERSLHSIRIYMAASLKRMDEQLADLSVYSRRDIDGITYEKAAVFFQLLTVERPLQEYKDLLLHYIKNSEAKNGLPEKLVHTFLYQCKYLLFNGKRLFDKKQLSILQDNIAFFSYANFQDLLKEKQILLQYKNEGKTQLLQLIRSTYEFSSVLYGLMLNPKYFFSLKRFNVFHLKNELKKVHERHLATMLKLVDIALNKNYDNFIYRWFSMGNYVSNETLSTFDKANIARYFDDDAFIHRIKADKRIPVEVKYLLNNQALNDAFEAMLAWQRKTPIDNHHLMMDDPSFNLQKYQASVYSHLSLDAKVSELISFILTLYNGTEARARFRHPRGLIGGVLVNMKSRGIFTSKEKRLTKLMEYQSLLQSTESEIELLIEEINNNEAANINVRHRQLLEKVKQGLSAYFNRHLQQLQDTYEGMNTIDSIKRILSNLHFKVVTKNTDKKIKQSELL